MALNANASPLEQEVQKQDQKTSELKKKKKGKRNFINEELFGASKTLEEFPSEEGISHLKIKVQENGYVDGLIKDLQKDLLDEELEKPKT